MFNTKHKMWNTWKEVQLFGWSCEGVAHEAPHIELVQRKSNINTNKKTHTKEEKIIFRILSVMTCIVNCLTMTKTNHLILNTHL